jgi:hypothetical protein
VVRVAMSWAHLKSMIPLFVRVVADYETKLGQIPTPGLIRIGSSRARSQPQLPRRTPVRAMPVPTNVRSGAGVTRECASQAGEHLVCPYKLQVQ